MSFFSSIIAWFRGSAIAQRAVDVAVANFEAQKNLLLPIAIELIKEVAVTTMSGTEKFATVVGTLAAKVPGIQKQMLNTFVQTTYEELKADPDVKEVQ